MPLRAFAARPTWVCLHPTKIPEEGGEEKNGPARSKPPHFSRFDFPADSPRCFDPCPVVATYFLGIREQQAEEEAQALDCNEGQIRLVADLAFLIDFDVDTERNGASNYVAEVAEREPGCNISTTLVALRVSCSYRPFDTSKCQQYPFRS